MSQQSEDEAIDTNHENIVQAYLQANHGSLCARGLQLNSEVLADQDIAPAIQPALALPQLQRRDLAYLLLLSLEPANLQHVLTAIQPLRTFDLVGLLPIELSRLVLIYLQPKELVACELVCKTWRTRARDSLVWRKVYCEAGYHVDTEAVNWWCGYGDHSISQHLFVDEGLADLAQPANASWTPPPKSLCLSGVSKIHQAQDGRPQIDFKHLYSLQVKAACNMRQGIFRVHEIRSPDRPHRSHSPPMYPDPPPTSVFHHDSIYCFQFLGNRLIAGGRNVDASPPQVIEWDLSTGQIMQVFAGHQASVLTLQFEAGLTNALVTGSSDGSLIVWDLDTATPRTEIAAHTKSVLNLHFDSQANTLVTASKDKTAKIWSMSNWEVVHTLRGHDSAVNSIEIKDKMIVTGSGDKTVRLWSAETGDCLRTFMGHTRGVASISFDGHRILSGGSDCSIRLHDFESEDPMAESLLTPNIYGRFQQTSKCVTRYGYRTAMSENHPISTNSDLVRTVQMDSRFAIVGSYDRSVKIINPTDGNLLCNILGAHSNAILHLQFDAYRVITSSQDGQIKVHDFLPDEVDKSFLV